MVCDCLVGIRKHSETRLKIRTMALVIQRRFEAAVFRHCDAVIQAFRECKCVFWLYLNPQPAIG
jgi:hypothetical protein